MTKSCMFCEGKLKILRAMELIEDVPEVSEAFNEDISEAFNLLDDAQAVWSGCCHHQEDTND